MFYTFESPVTSFVVLYPWILRHITCCITESSVASHVVWYPWILLSYTTCCIISLNHYSLHMLYHILESSFRSHVLIYHWILNHVIYSITSYYSCHCCCRGAHVHSWWWPWWCTSCKDCPVLAVLVTERSTLSKSGPGLAVLEQVFALGWRCW